MKTTISSKFINFPIHCLEIDQILLNEQQLFCQTDSKIQSCDSSATSIPAENLTFGTVTQKTCFNKCQCIFQDDINLLECTDPSITSQVIDFSSKEAWDHVNFIGSSIRELKEFKNLSLKPRGTIRVSGIESFDDDLFQSTNYIGKLGLYIENSSTESLKVKAPFRNTSFSELDINDSVLGQYITITTFIDSNVDILSIRNPKKDSASPAFRRDFLIGDISIKKFLLKNGFGIYKANSPTGNFAIDPILMNIFMFQHLEELEIVNTYLDFIIPAVLLPLEKLKVVRFANVNLKNVIGYYFSDQFQFGSDNFEDASVNWLANPRIQEIYIGREDSFKFQNDYLCYFAGLNSIASEIFQKD